MKVTLQRQVTDYEARRRYSIYQREDGKFFVLAVPTNPWHATDKNVHEFVVDTLQEALELT